MKKDPIVCTDLFWRLMMRLTNFLGERGIERQNQDNKRLISGLTVRQQQVIRKVYILTLRRPEGVPLKMLAEQLELSPGTVSEAVETLVRKQALEREICATDRRSVRIRVSQPGREMIDLGIDQYLRDAELLLSALSQEEVFALVDMLERMQKKVPSEYLENI